MRIEPGIEEGDSYAATCEAFISVHSQRCWKCTFYVHEDVWMRLELLLCARKDADTVRADMAVGLGVRLDKLLQVFRQVIKVNRRTVCASAQAACMFSFLGRVCKSF